MKYQRLLISAILCGSLLCFSSGGRTEEQTKTISEKEIIKAESLGTLNGPRDGALPRSAWKGTKRSLLMNALDGISSENSTPAIYKLKKKILLSATNAADIENDIKPEAGDNLLIKRLQKLNEIGAFEDSLALYSKLETPFHTALARQGMTAMLGSMKSSLACLELKSINESAFGDFEKELNIFCTHLLSEDENEDEKSKKTDYPLLKKLFTDSNFVYTPTDFDQLNKKSLIKKVALLSQDKIDFSKLEKADLHEISLETLSLLLSYEKLPERLRIPLAIKAAQTGLKPYGFITDTYEALSQNAIDEVTIHESEDTLKEWQKLPFIYARLNNKENAPSEDDKVKKLTSAVQLANTYGIESLYPFAPYFTEKRLEALLEAASDPASDHKKNRLRKTLIRTLLLLDDTHTKKWQVLLGDEPQPFALLLSRFINKNISKALFKEETEKEINATFRKIPRKIGKHLFFLSSILDKQILFIHNPVPVYEKQTGLTIQSDYVMPYVGLNDSRSRAIEDKKMGEIVLLNVLALQHAHPGHLYPGLLDSVLRSFENVGLNREAQELKEETFLELSKKIGGE